MKIASVSHYAPIESPASPLWWTMRGLTFELSWSQRRDARARLAKMYRVPPTGPAWHAVGSQLERGVRPHWVGTSVSHAADAAKAAARRRRMLGNPPRHCIAPRPVRGMTAGGANLSFPGGGLPTLLPANANGRERCRCGRVLVRAAELAQFILPEPLGWQQVACFARVCGRRSEVLTC